MGIVYLWFGMTIGISFVTIRMARNKFGFYLNHYTVTNVAWLLFIYLSLFHNNYFTQVSPDVYMIFLVGLIFYDITIIFVRNKKIKTTNELHPIVISLKLRRILEVITISSLLPQAYTNYKLMQSGVDLFILNYDYWHEVRNAGTYWDQTYQQLFIIPLSYVLICSMFYKNYKIGGHSCLINIIVGFFIALLSLMVSGGGRSETMFVVYVTLVSFLCTKQSLFSPYIFKPSKFIYVLLVACCIYIIQFANEGRGKSGDFIQEAINGQIIFAPLFEHYLKNTDVFMHNTFGASMFEFIITFIQYPFRLLFGIEFYREYNNSFVMDFVYLIPLGKEVNAGVSAYFYYMRDFGILGVAIGPMIVAGLLNWLYGICRKNSFRLICYQSLVLVQCFSTRYVFPKHICIEIILFCLLSYLFANKLQRKDVI